MKIDPNSPAFPTDSEHQNGPNSYHYSGLSARAHIASLALQGMLSYNDSPIGRGPLFAQNAIEYADALIAELNK